ncbi:MAG: hypothetical protein PF961_09565 [Planctomycetota bacterium]|nr:hypothetical protein [Planctomycetota bacterium]
MIDRLDLIAGTASTACHIIVWLTLAVLSGQAMMPEAEPSPEPSAALVPVPESQPEPEPLAALVLPAEASAPELQLAADTSPTELPPLSHDDFLNPPQLMNAEVGADSSGGDAFANDLALELPPLPDAISALQAKHHSGADRTSELERDQRQINEAKHVFEGWLRQAYRSRWQREFGPRLRNRQLVLLVTVTGQHRVTDASFITGTGIDELDTRMRLFLEERAHQGKSWGLPPLPNHNTASYTFTVTLPK